MCAPHAAGQGAAEDHRRRDEERDRGEADGRLLAPLLLLQDLLPDCQQCRGGFGHTRDSYFLIVSVIAGMNDP